MATAGYGIIRLFFGHRIVSVVTMQHQELVFCVLQKTSLQIKPSWNDAG